jgi:nitric-oxide synthase
VTIEDRRRRFAAVPFFSSLAPAELDRLAAQAVDVTASPGEVLLREGDAGDRMFVVDDGAVQIYTTGFDASDVVLARLGPGDWFGEQALLPGGTGRRNASARALDECRLLAISRAALLEALDPQGETLRQLRAVGEEQRLLRGARLTEGVFASLGVAVREGTYRLEDFRAGDVVFEQGAPGERVYLIVDGRAEVRRRENGRETLLAELLPGQFFGELAILHDEPRAATVRAAGDLKTVSLDGAWFRGAIRDTPALRSLMESLETMYLLPLRGVVTLQTGRVDGRPALTAVHTLPDGRRVVSTRLVQSAAFTSRLLDAGASASDLRFENAARGVYHSLGIRDGRIVELHAEGEWTGLGEMLGRLLDGTAVEEWQLALFRERGEFSTEDARPLYADAEVICACTHATCGQIQRAIADGAHTLDAVAARTRATMVCGGCAPLVKEMLGDSTWTAASVVETVSLADDIRTFRIRPASGVCPPHRPGQHVVLQARIDNRWIQRAYTLSSAPGSRDTYEITMQREPQGVFSRWFFDRMRPDALLRVSDPSGHYFLADDETRDVVCLVGGIGLTPALAMARSLAARPRPIALHIDYSVSTRAQAICGDELATLPRMNPKISVNVRITREAGRFGAGDARELVRRFPGAVFYLCGGDPFMDALAGQLRACGVADERIRIETFTVAGEKPVGPEPDAATGCPVAHGATVQERPATPLEGAKAFLRQYYRETSAASVFDLRWRQVEEEFRTTGTYRQTPEELGFAARLGWRNATRCVGRLYWEGLALRDFRQARTGEEMLDAIMGHVEIATNGGALRPVITVFPQRDAKGVAPRVWSPQLFRYAGYTAADGSVLGDPANVELTDVALSLGWQPPEPRTAFDLLPVIVQAAGERPAWREIPRALVMEIPIVHPELPWFAELGLKWYALPAVSAMLFEAGGVEYPAAPFNGWYMGTEIGARNFGDTSRYNLLPVVARKMGLDTSADRKLWRDRAIVELNVAVLHSYERAGVTMIDHHAAAHAFDKFEAIETQAGREVHARWSWIVPPISGSTTTVFHREWRDIELTPMYRAQPDAWKDDDSWRRR